MAPLAIDTVPAFLRMPLTVRSVPAPLASVSVTPLPSVICPPAFTTTWSTTTAVAMVTVCPDWIVITPSELVGGAAAATQFVPSKSCHVAAAPQLPEATERKSSSAWA